MARITDKERLDWLEARKLGVDWSQVKLWYIRGMAYGAIAFNSQNATPRAAIDAAIRAERKPKEAKP